ncbi:hypothetical protein COY95_03960, partial [Candidatus Woesearchaeota archaeon CG_4_10_14_0_8_um_filter_47_5]
IIDVFRVLAITLAKQGGGLEIHIEESGCMECCQKGPIRVRYAVEREEVAEEAGERTYVQEGWRYPVEGMRSWRTADYFEAMLICHLPQQMQDEVRALVKEF